MAKRMRSRRALPGIKDTTTPRMQVVGLTVMAVLLFLVQLFSIAETNKVTALILMVLALCAGVVCLPTLRQRINLPLLLLLLLVLMNGISLFYAQAGKFALREFLKLVTALCSGLLLLMLTPGEGVKPGRRIATVLEGASALAALFSIDLISTRLLVDPLRALLNLFSTFYQNMPGVEPGVRMVSLFDNPNIFAGCVGIGVLLSLSLAMSSEGKKERRLHLCCLYVSAAAFVLAFSMGASFSIALAFIAYLLLEHGERRGELLLLMVKTLVLVMLGVLLTAATALDTWDGIQVVPILCLVVGSALLCLADAFLGRKLAEHLRTRKKAPLVAILVLVVLLAGFALAAYNVTGGVSLAEGDTLRRSAYPTPGTYTLTADGGDGVQVTVESQNRQDTMMHTASVLYKGALSDASFTVPEDSQVLYFTFKATNAAELRSVEYVGSEDSGRIPLGYKLLPEFIANRIQGLFSNQNAIQRTVFFEDGMKLFRRSPIVGLGLGTFENAICSVQSFFYETKYVHNHYIQILLETGVIGLLLFVGLIGVSAAVILISRKRGNFHPLTPALGGALVFMAVHCATEVVFSSQFYLPLAFGVFILISLCCGDALSIPLINRSIKNGTALVSGLLIVAFLCVLCGNLFAAGLAKHTPTFAAIERAAEMDKFEWADYALSYVLSTVDESVPDDVREQAEVFATRLSKLNSNIIPLRLTQYYLYTGRVTEAMEMANKYTEFCASSSSAWNALFVILSYYYIPTEEFHEGTMQLVHSMLQWDEENIGSIELNEDSVKFIEFISEQ